MRKTLRVKGPMGSIELTAITEVYMIKVLETATGRSKNSLGKNCTLTEITIKILFKNIRRINKYE